MTQFLFGRRGFYDETEIIDYAKNSAGYDGEDLLTARALLIFRTNIQHTWLVASAERLYCLLDDVREDRPHVNWWFRKAELVQDGQVVVPIRAHERGGRKSKENLGLVDIGDRHRNWLYSKRLFADGGIDSSIKVLIAGTMV